MPPPLQDCLPKKFSGTMSICRERYGKNPFKVPSKVRAELIFDTIGSSRPLQYAVRYKTTVETSFNTMNLSGSSHALAKFAPDSVHFSDGRSAFTFFSTATVIKEINMFYDAIDRFRRERQPHQAGVVQLSRSLDSCANSNENELPQRPRCLSSTSTSSDEGRAHQQGESEASTNDLTRPCRPLVAAHSSNLCFNSKPPKHVALASTNVTNSTGWLSKETGSKRKQRAAPSRQRSAVVRRFGESAYIDDTPIESGDEPDTSPLSRYFKSGPNQLLDPDQPAVVKSRYSLDSVASPKRLRLADSYSNLSSPKSTTSDAMRDVRHFGFVGFANVGNSCYLNAVLQALFALPTFTSDLNGTIKHWTDLIADFGLETLTRHNARSVLVSVQHLLDYRNARPAMSSSLTDCVNDLKDGLARLRSSQFTDYAQKDAQELLCMLLEAMERELSSWASKIFHEQKLTLLDCVEPAVRESLEEMKYVDKPATCFCRTCYPLRSVTSPSQHSVLEAATLQRFSFSCINVSRWNPAESNFAFVLQVSSTCLECSFEKCVTDDGNALLLNVVQLRDSDDTVATNGSENARLLAARHCATVQDLVDWFAVGERVQMDCQGCGARCTPHIRRRRFLRTPRVLVIVALRYRYGMHGEKLDQRFIVPPYVTLARFVHENVVCPPAWQPDAAYRPNAKCLSDQRQSASATSHRDQVTTTRRNLLDENDAATRPLYQRTTCDKAIILSDSEDEAEFNTKSQALAIRNLERINTALSFAENDEMLPQIGVTPLHVTKPSFECLQDTKLDDEEALRIAMQHSLTEYEKLSECQNKSPQKQSIADCLKQQTNDLPTPEAVRRDENVKSLNCSFGSCPLTSSPLPSRKINLVHQKALDSMHRSPRSLSVQKISAQSELSKGVIGEVVNFSERSSRDGKLASEELTLIDLSSSQLDGADALRVVDEPEDTVESDIAAYPPTTELPAQAMSDNGAASALSLPTKLGASCTENATHLTCEAGLTTNHSNSVQVQERTVAGDNEDTECSDEELNNRLDELRSSVKKKRKLSSDSDETAVSNDETINNFNQLGDAVAARSSVAAAGMPWKGVQQIERETHLYAEDPEFIDHILQNGETGELPHSYRLVAVVSHHGTLLNNGHYVSDVYDAETQSWTRCDDDQLSDILEDELLEQASRNGYIFFYSCKDIVQQLEGRAARLSTTTCH